MASTISRATWTNDSGTAANPNGDGTILNNTRLQQDVYDKVDALVATNPLVLNAVTLDAQPHVMAYHSTTQTVTNTVGTALLMDSELYDIGGMHSTVSATSRLVIPTNHSGLYYLRGQVCYAADADGVRGAYFRKNDTTDFNYVQVPTAGGSNTTVVQIATVVPLVAGDFVELYGIHSAGADLALGSADRKEANEFIAVKLF